MPVGQLEAEDEPVLKAAIVFSTRLLPQEGHFFSVFSAVTPSSKSKFLPHFPHR